MHPRINLTTISPGLYSAMAGLEKYIHSCGLEKKLVHMLKLRASQINGCAYCIDMHWKDARAMGETEQRLYGLSAWREAPYYTPQERAALEWTEAVTRIAENDLPDELYNRVREHFSEKEMADLTLVITTINAWNRLAIAFRSPPGTYQPPKH